MKQTVSFLCWRIYSTPQREATQTAVLQLISFSHRSTHFKTAIHIYSSQSTEDLWIQLWTAAISTLIQPHMSSKTDWKFTAPKKKLTQSVKFLWVGFEKTEIGWLRANTVGALYKIDGRPWSYQPCPEACWIKINHSGLCINHQEGAWAGGVCSRKRWGKIFEIYGRRYCTMWERWSKNNKSPSPVQIIYVSYL